MVRHQTNTAQTRELTDAELDRVSGGNTSTKTTTTAPSTTQKVQNQMLITMQDAVIANY